MGIMKKVEKVEKRYILWDRTANGFVCTNWGAYYSTDPEKGKAGSEYMKDEMMRYFPGRFIAVEVVA